jgi:HK97 gp10 family phage protein
MTSLASADVSRLAEALRRTAEQSDTTTQQVLVSASNQILAEMEARVPVDTGNLRRSLQIKVGTDKVVIGPNTEQAPYAIYVERGTQPHVITPKKPGGVLRFKVGGTWVYARKVHHPGTQAQPFIEPAFEAWVDSLGTMAAEANVKVFEDNAP